MPGFEYYSEGLLQPISPEQPSGADLRYDKLFDDIAQARSADEEGDEGIWEKATGRKVAEWDQVARLCISALEKRTKDLRLACYLSEAAIRLDGFAGLRDCLRLATELINRFWDRGLYPAVEDGDLDYRASALVWLNDRMPDVIGTVLLTARTGGDNYGYSRYQQAQRVGTQASIASVSGEKREGIEALIRQGWITLDTFQAALQGTKRAALEQIYQPFDEAHKALLNLEGVAVERFGEAAPTFGDVAETFRAIDSLLAPVLKKKQREDAAAASPERGASPETTGGQRIAGFTEWAGELPSGSATGWAEADALIRGGQVDQGLAQMAALASRETNGRARFLRKLTLCDVCIVSGRDRLARTILEELSRLVDELKLDQWESSGLVGAVWSRLYRMCKKSEAGDDQAKARILYDRLCQLDPWQAYISCED